MPRERSSEAALRERVEKASSGRGYLQLGRAERKDLRELLSECGERSFFSSTWAKAPRQKPVFVLFAQRAQECLDIVLRLRQELLDDLGEPAIGLLVADG
jgi:hypothetical protein